MTEILPDATDNLDPQHFKKVEMNHFSEYCTDQTKCVMSNRKQGIPADSKEIKETKIKRRYHLLARRTGLGFNLI